jgi:hypothetical protein
MDQKKSPIELKIIDGFYQLPADKLNETITVGIEECLLLNTAVVNDLLEQNEELRAKAANAEKLEKEVELLTYGVLQICGVLGLTNKERTALLPSVVSGDEGVFTHVMKAGADLFGLFMKTSLPGKLGKSAEEQVRQRFEFIEKILPMMKEKQALAEQKAQAK